jgi:polygalacturonase
MILERTSGRGQCWAVFVVILATWGVIDCGASGSGDSGGGTDGAGATTSSVATGTDGPATTGGPSGGANTGTTGGDNGTIGGTGSGSGSTEGPSSTGIATGTTGGTTTGSAASGGVSGGNSTGKPDAGTGGNGATAASGSSGSTGAAASSDGGPPAGTCGAGDANLPSEPTFPPACKTLQATQTVDATGLPSESALDTSAIQAALSSCSTGQAVKLVASGSHNAFITGPLTIPAGVTLWVDSGTTLYGTRDPNVYGSAAALISVGGANSGIVGDGVIDGQGGEPKIGSTQSWWDVNGGGGSSPALINVRNATNFTLYRITLHNSPMFHVKLAAKGFVVWGVNIKTPSKTTNSAGTALSPSSAHNTDGVDPGEQASDGYIVCSKISVGDDHIAIKGSSGVDHLTIAHNHFGAGHGMSIGSEFQGGVSNVDVYDLSIDGTNTGLGGGSSNGIRIKSDSSRGGLVNNITYSDVCTRDIVNPIFLTPKYSTMTGTSIPQYTNITIRNFHAIAGSSASKVTLDGYSSSYLNSVTLDNVVIDGISPANVVASYTKVTLGPGAVNFTPSGTGVTVTNAVAGASQPNPCTDKWVTF